MALVAYEASSSEESDDEDVETSSKVIIPEVKETKISNSALNTEDSGLGEHKNAKSPHKDAKSPHKNAKSQHKNETPPSMEETIEQSGSGIFTALPQPKSEGTGEIIEEEDEFLRKKAIPDAKNEKKPKAKIKIGVPALSQYDSDEDEPKSKKTKSQVKASGLFALLPAPKTTPITTKSFVPNVLTKKTSKPLVPRKLSAAKKATSTVTSVKTTKVDDANTDDSDLDDVEVPETFDEETWMKVCGQRPARPRIIEPVQEVAPQFIEIAPEPVKPYSGLDNEGFKQLVGKMRKKENIEVVDINEDDILPDKDTWMIKSLTDPNQAPKYVVKDPVNDTCKRKHHITYLAQQAKANEQELQNQWASSRFNRKQTQSKYGF